MIFVGRFVEKKGLGVLKVLATNNPKIQFALVGKGPIRPQEWELPNIIVLDQQPQSSVADLYRAGDVLLLPSVGEGYPLVIQEAMACGLPVICGEHSAQADPAASQWLTGVDIQLDDRVGSAKKCAQAIEKTATSSLRLPSHGSICRNKL